MSVPFVFALRLLRGCRMWAQLTLVIPSGGGPAGSPESKDIYSRSTSAAKASMVRSILRTA